MTHYRGCLCLFYSYFSLWAGGGGEGQLSLSSIGEGSRVSFISASLIGLFRGQMVPLIPKQKHKHKPSPGVGERAGSQPLTPQVSSPLKL